MRPLAQECPLTLEEDKDKEEENGGGGDFFSLRKKDNK